MRTRLAVPLTLGMLLVMTGCNDRIENPLNVTMPSDGAVTVSVSSESGTLTPTYRWTGEGGRSLTVRDLGTGQVMWRLEATDPNEGFQAPVRHGVVPVAARQTASQGLLEPSVQYEVSVVTLDGQAGSRQFTPDG